MKKFNYQFIILAVCFLFYGSFTVSAQGTALEFDETDDYVTIPDDATLDLTSTFTLEAWVLTPNTALFGLIMSKAPNSGSGYNVQIFRETPRTYNFSGPNGSINNIQSPEKIESNRWYHIAVSYNSASTMILYVNGVQKASRSVSDAVNVNDLALLIGKAQSNAYFGGQLDEIRIWNTERTQLEINNDMMASLTGSESGLMAYYNFNEGSGTSLSDQTSNGNNGTLTNMDATTDWVESYAMVVPRARSASFVETTSFTANWSAQTTGTAEKYLLDVSTSPTFTSFLTGYKGFDAGTATSVAISGLNNQSTTYYYRVRAFKASVGDVGAYSSSIMVTTLTPKLDQTITFDTLSDKIYGDSDIAPEATASSKFEVSYSSENPDIATIVDNQIRIVSPGTVTIYADQAGNDTYNPAPQVSQILTITAKELTVTDAMAADKTYDGTADATISGAMLSGVVGTDDVILENIATGTYASINVGTDLNVATAMTISGDDMANYSLTQPMLTADIRAVILEIMADPMSKIKGEDDPEFTYNIFGGRLVMGDELTGMLDREIGEDIGEYAINQGTLSAGSNYDLIFISADLTITVTLSIPEKQRQAVSVYPNPTAENIFVEAPFNSIISIMDINGSLIMSQTVNSLKEEINVKNMNPGLYIVTIVNNGDRSTKKIVVK